MEKGRFLFGLVLCGLFMLLISRFSTAAEYLKEQNENLFKQLQQVHGLSDSQLIKIREIFFKSGYIGQGNPAITRHPATPEE
jgi:hypothetical protein